MAPAWPPARAPATSARQSARAWAEGRGLIQGDENGALRYKMFVTREELAVLLQRAAEAEGKSK